MKIFNKIFIETGLWEFILIYGALIIFILIFAEIKNRKKSELYKVTSGKLIKAFDNQTIKSFQDVENICKSSFSNRVLHNNDIKTLLLSTSENYYLNKSENSERSLETIKRLIDEVNKKEPFSGLPQTEKTILNNLLEFKDKIGDNSEGYVSKLHDLSHLINEKYVENSDLLKKGTRHTKISYFVGLAGIIISIIISYPFNNKVKENPTNKASIQSQVNQNKIDVQSK